MSYFFSVWPLISWLALIWPFMTVLMSSPSLSVVDLVITSMMALPSAPSTHGITVVCSAGNSGPAPATVSNVSPWIFTVASTLDREFQSFVQLANGERFKGESMSKALPVGKMYSLTTCAQAKLANASATDAMLCKEGTLDPQKATGKIMVCLTDNTARVEQGRQAALAGAVAMILCNDKGSGNDITPNPHFLPATQINFVDSQALFSYVNLHRSAFGIKTNPTYGRFLISRT